MLEAATFYAGGEWGAAAWSGRGLVSLVLACEVEAEAGEELLACLRDGAAALRRRPVRWVAEPPFPLAAAVGRYLAGEPETFAALPIDLSPQPPFTAAVLAAVREVPYGEVRSYGWVAARAGKPRAFRATGQAVGRNPLPLLIPCHRIVGRDGRLVGFGAGHGRPSVAAATGGRWPAATAGDGALARKAHLLALEGVRVETGAATPDSRVMLPFPRPLPLPVPPPPGAARSPR